MKKLGIVFLLFTSLLFSEYVKNIKTSKINLELILSGALTENVEDIEFYNDKILAYSYNMLVVKNIKNQFINTLSYKNIHRAKLYKNRIFIHPNYQDYIDIYPINGKDRLNRLLMNFQPSDFIFINDNMYALYRDSVYVYSLKTGEKIKKLKIGFSADTIFPTYTKGVFLIKQYNNVIDIFKKDTLINKLVFNNSLINANIVDSLLFTAEKNTKTTFNLYSLQTLKKIASFSVDKNVKSAFITKNGRYIVYSVEKEKKIYIFDLKKAQTVSYFEVKYPYGNIKLSDDNRYLGVYYSNGVFDIYKTDKIKGFASLKLNKKTSPVLHKPAEKTIPHTPVKNSAKTAKKPALSVHASISEGFVPLKVIFNIITDNKDKIIGYYVNFGDSEMLKDGRPPLSIKHTYTKPGVYKVLIAVKNANGEISQKRLKIKVKEETFEDFKKIYGN